MHEEQSSRGLPPRHALRLLHGEWACDAVGGRAAAGRTRRPHDSLPQGGPWPWGSPAWSREVPLTSLLTSVCSAPSGPPGPGSFTSPLFEALPGFPPPLCRCPSWPFSCCLILCPEPLRTPHCVSGKAGAPLARAPLVSSRAPGQRPRQQRVPSD